MFCNGVRNRVRNGGLISITLIGFVIRKDNGSDNPLFLSCQMGLSDVAFFMIKHTQWKSPHFEPHQVGMNLSLLVKFLPGAGVSKMSKD